MSGLLHIRKPRKNTVPGRRALRYTGVCCNELACNAVFIERYCLNVITFEVCYHERNVLISHLRFLIDNVSMPKVHGKLELKDELFVKTCLNLCSFS